MMPVLFPGMEWLVCLLVVGIAVFWRGKRGLAAVMLVVVILGGWTFGSAKGFLGPVALGGGIVILLGGTEKPWRWLGKCAVIGGAAGTVLLCWLFPIPEAPPLTGKYSVGTIAVEIPAVGSPPRLMVQVWYPTDGDDGNPAVAWLPDGDLAPAMPYHRLAFAMAHARHNLAVANVPRLLPVVFYEHSWMGHRAENVAQVEELASEGFVVVAVDHPGQAGRVLYPDGTVLMGRYPEPLDFSSAKNVGDFVANSRQCFTERAENLKRVRKALVGSVAGKLSGRMRLDRVGVFGFSFGGSMAVRLCAEDPAFVAGANEDGLFLGEGSLRGPFLFFDEETPAWLEAARKPDENAGQIITREAEARIQNAMLQPQRDRFILDGTRHLSFSDRIYASRFPRLARVGTRPAEQVHDAVCKRLAEFFRVHLD